MGQGASEEAEEAGSPTVEAVRDPAGDVIRTRHHKMVSGKGELGGLDRWRDGPVGYGKV